MTWWHLLWAGSSSLIFHWGTGVAIIIICILLEIFTEELGVIPLIGPLLVRLLTPIRKDLLWVAGCTAIAMLVYTLGVHDESKRCQAQTAVVEKSVTKAVHDATQPPPPGVRDKFDTDK